ncbi:long-chain fatty acid--CoA ligase [Bacillus sp. FJAT-25509]|uniref:long-chain-fatty-acid--CoA ligase n=1 Tax=Bacillus sp. FJAT-25509 TaxID=1712029 RepID=UPI0006F9AC76|nr:long-chain-fatty-acid--CoA ligase [Bacillus sp. FJAT-25509]KQL36371.1 long-chain fatty acid--CoA ligase [Bacillus sp. FJAT-25509]
MSFGNVLSLNAKRHPDKLALVYQDRTYTYMEFNKVVNRFAWGLQKLGIKKGEKLALMMANSDLFVIGYCAAVKVGAVVVPINFRLVSREVEYILEQSDSVLVICDSELEKVVLDASKSSSKVRNIITAPLASSPNSLSFFDVLSSIEEDPQVEISGDDDFHLLYTSGTTGQPKGALFDYKRIEKLINGLSAVMGQSCQDRLLHVAPLFHCAQLVIFLLPGLYLGMTNVIHRDFNPLNVLKDIEKYKITLFFGVPTMYNYLQQVPNADQYDLSSIKRCAYGAAPMPPEILMKSMKLFNTNQFFSLCGLTEGGPTGFYLSPEDHELHFGKTGKTPLLYTIIKIVNQQDEEVLPGEVGELILKGETIMKEYYKKPKETAVTIKDGWLYTGDLAVVDEEGYITLVDRSKDMLISGGENIYSVEIENVLYEHHSILEAAVIGTPDAKWGEVVTAIVVLKPGHRLSFEEIGSFCRERMAGYKIPRIVEFIDQLPRNASGKVQKFILREIYCSTNSK